MSAAKLNDLLVNKYGNIKLDKNSLTKEEIEKYIVKYIKKN